MPSTRTPNSRQAATSVDSTRRYPSEPIPVTVCPTRIGAPCPSSSLSPRAPFQEADHQSVELVELLQLRPVPAAAEHVQLRPADQLERHKRAVEGVHSVLSAPHQQDLVPQPLGLPPEQPFLGVSRVVEGG